MVPIFQHWRRKTLKIYHVLEDLNYGILRMYAEFWKKIYKKSIHRLSEELGASKDTIHCQIKTYGKSYRSCRSVPHELTPQQDQRRLNISHLIGNTMDDIFFRRIVTCDEKWVYYRNPDTSKQWLSPRQPAKVIVKKISLVPE